MVARKDDEQQDEIVTRPTRGVEPEPGEPNPQKAVTGRPNDLPIKENVKPVSANSTFADRVKDRDVSEKRIVKAQNKAVQSADTK